MEAHRRRVKLRPLDVGINFSLPLFMQYAAHSTVALNVGAKFCAALRTLVSRFRACLFPMPTDVGMTHAGICAPVPTVPVWVRYLSRCMLPYQPRQYDPGALLSRLYSGNEVREGRKMHSLRRPGSREEDERGRIEEGKELDRLMSSSILFPSQCDMLPVSPCQLNHRGG